MALITQSKTIFPERDIFSKEKGSLLANRDVSWIRESFLIPPLPPSRLDFCKIINLEYRIVVSNIHNQ